MRSYGINSIEYCLIVELNEQVDKLHNMLPALTLNSKPFIKLISFNRRYQSDMIINKIARMKKLIKKTTPVQLLSNSSQGDDKTVIGTISNYSYLLHLRDAVGQIFDVRQYDRIDSKIYVGGSQHINKYSSCNEKLSSESLIWATSSVKIYQRPYISNK